MLLEIFKMEMMGTDFSKKRQQDIHSNLLATVNDSSNNSCVANHNYGLWFWCENVNCPERQI